MNNPSILFTEPNVAEVLGRPVPLMQAVASAAEDGVLSVIEVVAGDGLGLVGRRDACCEEREP